MQEPIKVDISKVESIKIEDGVLVITPKQEEVKLKLPEVGYYADEYSVVCESRPNEWRLAQERNLYPRKNHAILVSQILAPLSVKHWELTGGYWAERATYVVRYSHLDYKWGVASSVSGIIINPLSFPFKDSASAHRFMEENKLQLNALTNLWQEG